MGNTDDTVWTNLTVVTVIGKQEGESTGNLKSEIKIRNTARLSSKLTIMILMV